MTGPKGHKTKLDSPHRLLRKAEKRAEARRNKDEAKSRTKEGLIDLCIQRIAGPADKEAFRRMLTTLVDNNAIPLALLKSVPEHAGKAGKTRFDQLYDVCMFLAFPEYRPTVKTKAFGPLAVPELRLWRALFPKEYGLSHVIIRASSFQEAFALACDYACRLSLRERHQIPSDLSIRVRFLPDAEVSRILDIRIAVRNRSRRASNARGRVYSPKDINGARLVAIGRREGPDYSIFKYAERKDLDRVLAIKAEMRLSAVDVETFRPKESSSPYDEP